MLRKIALNSAGQYAATAVGMVVTFFLTPFLVARLGRESMGLQTLASQALAFIGLFTGAMGVSYTRAATVRYAKGEYEEMNAVIGAGVWLSVVTGVLFLAGALVMALYPEVLFGIRGGLVRDASWVIVISGLTSAVLTMTGPWSAPLQLAQSTYWQSLGNIVATVAGGLLPCVLLLVLAEPFITAWVGAGFAASSVPVLRIIIVGTAVSLPTMIGYETLVALGKIGEAVISTLVGGVCNVVLAVVFVKYFGWGLEGIALACVLTMGLRNLIYTPLLLIRHSGVAAGKYYVEGVVRPMAGAVVLAGLVLVIRMVAVPVTLVGVMGCFVAGAVLYVPVVLLVTFRAEDRALALKMWTKATERWRRVA